MTVLMDAVEQRVDIGQDAVAFKLNDGQTGFYRVRYADPENLERLGEMVREKTLPPEDRWGLQNDLYALTVAGEVPLSAYLDYLRLYASEDAYLPLAASRAICPMPIRQPPPGRGRTSPPWPTLVRRRSSPASGTAPGPPNGRPPPSCATSCCSTRFNTVQPQPKRSARTLRGALPRRVGPAGHPEKRPAGRCLVRCRARIRVVRPALQRLRQRA